MPDFLHHHAALLAWVFVASAVMFVATLVLVPVVVIRLPADYFAHEKRGELFSGKHPVVRIVWTIAKNVLGVVFVAAGIAMLVLPGQGILTIVLGVALLDLPGKFRLIRWLVRRRAVARAINALRARAGRPPLRFDPIDSAHSGPTATEPSTGQGQQQHSQAH